VTATQQDPKTIARRAIEEVCARGDFEKAGQFYSPHFRDHVNDLEYSGLEGVRESVSLYRSIFPDLEIAVEDQVVEDPRVLAVRAGIASGDVLLRDGDVFGPIVNLAARAVKLAGPGIPAAFRNLVRFGGL
jgi:class 3 adenylate cyclase